jgi:hypothetical protein
MLRTPSRPLVFLAVGFLLPAAGREPGLAPRPFATGGVDERHPLPLRHHRPRPPLVHPLLILFFILLCLVFFVLFTVIIKFAIFSWWMMLRVRSGTLLRLLSCHSAGQSLSVFLDEESAWLSELELERQRHRSCRAPHCRGKDRDQEEECWLRQN